MQHYVIKCIGQSHTSLVIGAVVVMIAWELDLLLSMQSDPITINIVYRPKKVG